MRLQEAFSYVLGWHDGVCSYVNPTVLPFAFKKFLEGHPLFYLKRTSVSVEIALLDCRHCLYIVDDEGDLERVLFCCKIYGACAIFMGSLKCSRNLTECYEEVHLVDDSDGEAGSCLFFHPRFMVLNKVASYSYEGDQHMEIPLPAIIPKEDNGKLIKCAEVGDEKVGKSRRAVDQFYAALSSQYKFIPYDFSFCTIGSSVPVPDAILESLKLCFSTGIVVDVDKLIHKDDFVWNSHWLPKYMADGAATVKITCDNYEGITAYLKQNNPMYKEIADDFAIVTIVIGQYVPSFAGCCAVSGFVLVSKCAMRDLDWGYLISHYKSCLDHFIFCDVRAKYMSSNIRSAIGSIMSRNGSHNIGSHVLAALSHNVGTMPDDRVLYQYIQHRMDYIATATTDFPQWTIPTLFVGGLMKNFYAQKHLLDYISRSEGLRAYKFQERNLDDAARKNQHGTIRIFVRKFSLQQPHEKLSANQYLYHGPDGKDHSIHYFFGERATLFRELPAEGSGAHRRCVYEVSDSGGTAQFLESNEKYVPEWDQDVRVAIPGGVIGQHAFYTIIENVIRNAAKHGWASDQNLREKDLEINVDFEENKDFVLFTIGDNVSDIFGGAKDFWDSFFSAFGSVKTAQETLKALNRLDGECPGWEDIHNWIKPPDPNKPDSNKLEEHEFQGLFLRACLKPLKNKEAKQLAECFPDDKTATEGKAGLPVFHRVLKAYGIKYQKDNNVKWEKGKDLVLPLHHDQHRKLAQSFINESGELRQENWGLAEMKISAGYLDRRTIEEIGGMTESGNDILIPIAMPGVCRNAQNCSNCISCSTGNFKDWSCYKDDENCPVKSRRFHLGYQFRIMKPKEMLFVISGQELGVKVGKVNDSVLKDLMQKGFHFAAHKSENGKDLYCGIGDDKALTAFNYRYVVFVDKNDGGLNPKFCFRQIYGLRDQAAFLAAVAKGNVDELRRMVFSAWLEKLKDARGFQGERIALTLNVRGTDAGSERGLVTAQDLMETMFKECYHTALIAFISDPPASIELSDTTKHLIMLLSLIKVMPETLQRVPENVDCASGAGIKECIRGQLSAYCDLLKTRLFLSCEFIDALKSISRYSHVTEEDADRGERKILRDIEEIGRSFEAAIARRLFRAKIEESDFVKRGCEALTQFLINTEKDDLDNWLDAFRGRCDVFNRFPDREQTRRGKASGAIGFDQTIKAVLNACTIPEEAEFEALVESLNSMFLASDVYLRKYEERIATLPEAYRHDDSRPQVQSELKLQDIVDRLINVGGSESVDRVIKYSRHDRSKPENAIYAEALSGSQSYLNSLSRMMSNLQGKEVTAQVTRLLENALLRVLIIDERMANFLRDHADDRMIETFSNMGIFVADVNEEEPTRIEGLEANALCPVKHRQYDENKTEKVLELNDDFDILIIHQGIIDKWWKEQKHNSVGVAKILENISEKCNGKNGGPLRVVVTTGRGRPDNIPDNAKVLPFSSVESALFRRYPEKVILVNTVLNLLPYKDVNGKSNT